MQLTCKLVPTENQRTLADLEPGIAAETEFGIRWRDYNGFVFGIDKGYPIIVNSNGSELIPKANSYLITGRILGKIKMKFEE